MQQPRLVASIIVLVLFAGPLTPSSASARRGSMVVQHPAVGLGPIVQSALGGQIFGWDINENGTDGVLTESVATHKFQSVSAVETFDQTTGKITKVVAKQRSPLANRELVVGGVLANDVGLIDDERDSYHGRNDVFHVMAPVATGKFTGTWNPPHDHDLLLEDVSDQQADPVVAILGYLNYRGGGPEVLVTNVGENVISSVLQFPPSEIYTGLYIIAQDTTLNQAIVPVISDQGQPAFVAFDLASGNASNFSPSVGRGGVLGIAIDSATDMMCTTTNDDYSVEFFSLKTHDGTVVRLPGAGGSLQDGGAIAADPINHLFLVGQPISSSSPSGGSTIYVYHEDGTLLETINGFVFPADSAVGASVHVNAALRRGFASGPRASELQSFTY